MRINKYPSIICISGRIASGKTYLSKLLAERNGWRRCSTSDFLRYLLCKEGLVNPSRQQLQEKGEEEINKGWGVFAKEFIEFAINDKSNKILLIDGVRHSEFFYQIKSLVSPQKCLLLYLVVSDELIQHRLDARGEKAIDFNCVAEGNQQELYQLADYITEGCLEDIEQFIKKRIEHL